MCTSKLFFSPSLIVCSRVSGSWQNAKDGASNISSLRVFIGCERDGKSTFTTVVPLRSFAGGRFLVPASALRFHRFPQGDPEIVVTLPDLDLEVSQREHFQDCKEIEDEGYTRGVGRKDFAEGDPAVAR